MSKTFHKTKVVSKNFFIDWVQSIRNMLGYELTGYSNIIDDTIEDLKPVLPLKYFRVSCNQLTNGAIMITVYGEYK